MNKFMTDLMFGLAFGIGLCLAYAALRVLAWFIGQATHAPMLVVF